jgi:CheY-like chemotaxis protein
VTRILIIDDDPDIRRVLADLLALAHEIVIASNGADAIEPLRGGDRFDVILSDVMMPRLDGVRLYRDLLELAPDQARRTAFMSSGEQMAELHRQLGSDRPYLEKPFDLTQLRTLVDDMLRRNESDRSPKELL